MRWLLLLSAIVLTMTACTGSDDDPPARVGAGEIAFVSGPEASPALHVMKADGTTDRAIPGAPTPAAHPAWSPDNTVIAFAGGDDLWTIKTDGSGLDIHTVDADGKHLTKITDNTVYAGQPAWRH